MNDSALPVTIAVHRPDGTIEQIRVGSAVPNGAGFTLQLGELTIAPSARTSAAPIGSSATGMVFPPYGRSKGVPIAGASLQDLEFYASGCRRTLSDAAKSRWHDKERVLLAAIEAELARQQGLPPLAEPPPPSDDEIPF